MKRARNHYSCVYLFVFIDLHNRSGYFDLRILEVFIIDVNAVSHFDSDFLMNV